MQAILDVPAQQPIPGTWPMPERAVCGQRAPLQVAMGQLKLGARTDQLQALLGSCVGIALIWKKRGQCALAHCLLPDCPQMANEFGARYVNQAVPSLLRLLGASQEHFAEIEVVLAGGATMLNSCSSRLQIGQQNVEAARKQLRKHGLNVSYCRTGGNSGRTLTVDCATCTYAVQEIVTNCSGATHA